MNGADLFLHTLIDEGVQCLFGNPGTTELPLMDALVNEKRIRYYLCLHESIVIGAAEGYAFATGGIGAVSLHVAPGLGNALGMLYNSMRAGTPLLVTAGNQSAGGQFQEIVLSDDLPRMAAPLVKWSYEVRRIGDLEQAVRRGVKVALTPPTGPVFLSIPGEILRASSGGIQERPTRIPSAFPAAQEAVENAARALADAQSPVIVAGSRVTRSGAEQELVRLAERMGAKVLGENFPNTFAFPNDHPLYAGELGRLAPSVKADLEGADVILFVGTEIFTLSYPPDVRMIPEDAYLIHLDLNPWEIGKNFSVDCALFGDPKTTLPALVREVEARAGAVGRERTEARRRKVEEEVCERRRRETPAPSAEDYEASGMGPPAFQKAIGEALPRDAVFVDESFTSGGPGLRRAVAPKTERYFGLKGGGIGLGLPTGVGVKAALPDRPVVCVAGDGSAMFTIQSLWTAARYDLATVFVIASNRSYRILKERALLLDGKSKEFHQFIGMELNSPEIDFVKLAEGMGVAGRRVERGKDLEAAIREALQAGKPCLIEAAIRNEEI